MALPFSHLMSVHPGQFFGSIPLHRQIPLGHRGSASQAFYASWGIPHFS